MNEGGKSSTFANCTGCVPLQAAEDDAVVVLLMRHASGLRVHVYGILVFGPVLDQCVQGGCEVDGIVHINCSSSRVRKFMTLV